MTLYVVFVVYLAVVLAIGALSVRKGGESAEEYFVAGRGFGTVVLFMALLGTNVSAFTLIGLPGLAYTHGIGVYGFFGAMVGFANPLCFILIGYPIWRFGKEHGYITPSQMFSDRWQSPAVGYLLFALLLFYTVPYIVLGIIGGGVAIEGLSAGESIRTISYPWAAFIVAIVTMLYTSVGGMRATAWTNCLQAGVFMLFIVLAFFGISAKMGGLTQIHQDILASHSDLMAKESHRMFNGADWMTAILVGPISVIAFPHMFMRFMCARTPHALYRSIQIYPLAILIIFVPVCLMGVWGVLEFPGMEGKAVDNVLPLLVSLHMPDWLSALGMVAILAAVMSTLDAQMLTVSTMLTLDVLKGWKERSLIFAGRLFVVALATVAFLIALMRPQTVFNVAKIAFSGYTLIIPLMVAAFYWKRSTAPGILIGSLVSHALLALYFLGVGIPKLPGAPVFTCILVEIALIFAVSLATAPPSKEIIEKFSDPFATAEDVMERASKKEAGQYEI